jgi:hypothetical protein
VELHGHLEDRSVFLRFFGFHPAPSAPEAEHFACVDYVNRLAMVAEIDSQLIAVGRFESLPAGSTTRVPDRSLPSCRTR